MRIRTQQKIVSAFRTVLRKKDFSAITVEDIMLEADISRGTFYRYFTDLPDLARKGFTLYSQTYFSSAESGSLRDVFSDLLHHIDVSKHINQHVDDSMDHLTLRTTYLKQVEKLVEPAFLAELAKIQQKYHVVIPYDEKAKLILNVYIEAYGGLSLQYTYDILPDFWTIHDTFLTMLDATLEPALLSIAVPEKGE